jgi:transposase
MRRVVLTKDEKAKPASIPKKGKSSLERNRSMCLLLSNQGYAMSKVAKLMNIERMTVVRLLDAWEGAGEDKRFSVLYREKGQGAKSKLEPVRNELPKLLERNNRNIGPVLAELEKEYGIKVCKITLQHFFKGTRI